MNGAIMNGARMNLKEFNSLSPSEAETALRDCCGSSRWSRQMEAGRPFRSVQDLFERADSIWLNLDRPDFLEAFACHARIGEKATVGSESSRQWSENEQAGTQNSEDKVKTDLAEGNRAYQERFGYIFIICATGKSGQEMLALLQQRLQNEHAKELKIAVEQQRLITRLRLQKLLNVEKQSGEK
jgi:2-oxo-4-hydroxy-4-carboxy-5-ureidoimidazoline decarboxylase